VPRAGPCVRGDQRAADVWQAVRWSAGGVLMAGLALLWIRRGSAPQPRLVRHRA